MGFPSEETPDVGNGKSFSDGSQFSNNGAKLLNASGNESESALSDSHRTELYRAHNISEIWKRTLANRDALKPYSKRPHISIKKLKQEASNILSLKTATSNESELRELLQNTLFLLAEAELHKNMLTYDCKRLKESFDRDVGIIREIHAKRNIPIAITNSILDSRLPPSREPSGEVITVSPVPESSSNAGNAAESWTFSIPPPPSVSPNGLLLAPPVPPYIPSCVCASTSICVSMPDVTKPPPTISQAASQQNQPAANNFSAVCPPPPTFPVDVPPPSCPSISALPPTGAPPVSLGTPASTFIQAALKPCTSFACSGPFGPPINSSQSGFPRAANSYGGKREWNHSAERSQYRRGYEDRRAQ